VERKLVEQAFSSGLIVTGQTRTAAKLANFANRIRVMAFDPCDQEKFDEFVRGQDAIIFALGTDTSGAGSSIRFSPESDTQTKIGRKP
jgi:putative NADH-flavin reductase